MNIFALDDSAYFAAMYHCDKHVVKMITETTQILSTACHLLGIPERYKLGFTLYRPTHKHRLCVKWAAESRGNFSWLVSLLDGLLLEYDHRFGKPEKFARARELLPCFMMLEGFIPHDYRTPFVLEMPEDCKGSDPVESYRRYYNEHKSHLHRWTKRDAPEWVRTVEAT
jgi:hypothetical protein